MTQPRGQGCTAGSARFSAPGPPGSAGRVRAARCRRLVYTENTAPSSKIFAAPTIGKKASPSGQGWAFIFPFSYSPPLPKSQSDVSLAESAISSPAPRTARSGQVWVIWQGRGRPGPAAPGHPWWRHRGKVRGPGSGRRCQPRPEPPLPVGRSGRGPGAAAAGEGSGGEMPFPGGEGGGCRSDVPTAGLSPGLLFFCPGGSLCPTALGNGAPCLDNFPGPGKHGGLSSRRFQSRPTGRDEFHACRKLPLSAMP